MSKLTVKLYCIVLICIVTIIGCDWGRTPSNIRFPKNFNVRLPSDVKVIRDEYEDMGNDYAIYYTVKLTTTEMNSFIYDMKHLNNFYLSPPSNENERSNKLLVKQYREGAWYKTSNDYRFFKENRGTSLNAFVDTVNLSIEFQEFGR